MLPTLELSWRTALHLELQKPYFLELTKTVGAAYQTSVVFPPKENIFRAFELCPLTNTRVVILGQDPYHRADQAQGLAFSVPDTQKIPPSLRNIYKELTSDIGSDIPSTGTLEQWARQGVLLLNATLTVEEGKPGSHQKLGWETFTDSVIKKISEEKEHVVFLLWGNYARAKKGLIDTKKHLVLEAPHPSPFSAHSGFLGCKHFSQTNQFLRSKDLSEISW